MDAKKEIIEAINILISKRMKKISSINFCTVINVQENMCTIIFNGEQYIVPHYGNTPIINKKYPIFLPDNNLSQAFIIG